MFSSLDVEAIGRALSGEELRLSLDPVFAFYNAPCESCDEREILAHLHRLLDGRPFVNQLIKAAAGNARDLGGLALEVFPGQLNARRALEGLLVAGTLARQKSDAPGLVPTRVHAMFRGVYGLYACLNAVCPGRQVDGGEQATLGRLFAVSQIRCDDCGNRVFEIAVLPQLRNAVRARLRGERALVGLRVPLGRNRRRFESSSATTLSTEVCAERTEEFRVHLGTGYLDGSERSGEHNSRSLFVWVDGEGARRADFERCAMCQPSG